MNLASIPEFPRAVLDKLHNAFSINTVEMFLGWASTQPPERVAQALGVTLDVLAEALLAAPAIGGPVVFERA